MENKFRISKEFHFSASHVLHGLPGGHPCGRLHGHNYVVVIHLESGTLDNVGFVQDYGELTEIRDWINNYWDHRHLNDFFKPDMAIRGYRNPTAEIMAEFLFDIFHEKYPKMVGVTVKETPKTEAYYGS